MFCFPVRYRNKIKGVCYLDNRLSGFVFSPENLDNINLLLTQAAVTMENISYRAAVKRIRFDRNFIAARCREFEITNAEREIVSLVIKGFTNKAIIKKKCIAINTAKSHLNNIYRKTGIASVYKKSDSSKHRDALIRLFTKFDIE